MEKVSAACAMDWSIKLEKALRSKNPARAAEVIMETGGNLEQWRREREPSTAVYNMFGLVPEEDRLFANTILLRLVDAFCSGDKLVRLTVVRVFMSMFKQSRRKKRSEWARGFLAKARVENHLELLKRVKDVYENGDIDGRAMALILFGCWRDFASDYAPIRYLIFTSMVSSHDLEVRSSLFAAACFSEVADDFALVVLGMLVDMVTFPELAPMTRLAAVRVFAKMGCSHAIANRAFKKGLKLMLDTSEEDNVVAFLVSLTKLAAKSTNLASELRETVMPFLDEDKTPRIRAVSLRCLHFLVERGMCFSLVHASTIEMLSSLLNKAELSPDMLIQALQILHKILAYKLCTADASDFSQLIIIVENASHSPIMSSSYSAISILADLVNGIVQTAEKRSLGVPSTSLPLLVIELITGKLTLLCRSCANPFQVDCALVGEVQNLFNRLRLVGKHSEMGPPVLDKIIFLLEYVRGLVDSSMKIDGAAPLVLGIVNYKGKRGTVVSFLDRYTQMVYSLLLHSQVVWGWLVNETKTKCDVDGNSDILLVPGSCEYGIFTLECSNQIFTEGDYWPVYRAGIHAARLGAWVTSAFIFAQLRTKVQSDIYSVWLKSLTYFAYAEGKIQLLSSPVGNSRLVNWLGSNDCLPEFSLDTSGKSDHSVVLHEAYKHLASSLEALESNVASIEVFCFQKWFMVLKNRVLGTVLDYFKLLDLFNQDINSGKKQAETRTLVGCNILNQFTQISIRLQTLAKEYDTMATCFIDIDHGSSNIIAEVALSCSVLAFAVGFALFIRELPLHETLAPCTSRSSLCSRLIQDLAGRLWQVDPEISKNLTLLVKVNEPSKNCFHLQPRNQTLRVCGKVKGLLSICRDVISGISSLREQVNAVHDKEIMSEITREHHHLLSEAVVKWICIPFGSPKYFFCIRPFVGSELFTRNSDSRNADRISVEQGFHLPLDLCLQLKNRRSKLPVQITRLYCLLYTRLAFHIPGEKGQDQSCCSPWKNEDLMEMSEKLFQHATKSDKWKDPERNDWKNSGKGVVAIVKLEPNERGQGFSSCLLDVTRFPVGSYQIKWQSCCIDSSGCYWNLLPLNAGPVFTVLKAPVP
ncbi:PREDICTED: uncharacterized protein LOC104806224 isoform X2 [Tarenaya hassleriana]|uniref:uncharacterized protein LOC104806224 isoform X2 n=1 Tax=Tarenaya hassleriana TaxID=28532 RepID=UPI00053C9D74|nr:PREDICTED: uncharacterized protein LOC104806224 isoform X2 [Tarenaya hassleriana]